MREFYAPQIAMDIVDAKNEGIAIGEEKGRTEGKAEGKAEIVRSALSMNLPIDQISQLTGLSAAEIQALKPH
jgi:predicted transposase/invertase (TIGR01784 family)